MGKRHWNSKLTLETGKKRCWDCCYIKVTSEFHRDESRIDGFMGRCKLCCKVFSRSRNRPYKPEQGFYHYRYSANKRGFEFLLSREEFVSFWGVPCRYCNYSFDKVRLDRVDSTKGYCMKNVVSCCKRCNQIKNDFTAEQIHMTALKFTRMAETIEKILLQ